MPPKNEQLEKMITKAQEQIDKMQAAIDAGNLDEQDQQEALQTIQDMTEKIERLTSKAQP